MRTQNTVPCDRRDWTRSLRTCQAFLSTIFFGIVTILETLLYKLNSNIKTTMPEINEFILFIQYDQFMFI